jgi:cellulose synthase/poly-beta-1,6-N-acetylglucosamine synthase-like glycosyltransferase
MNYYLDHGAKALQSSDLVEPRPGVWSAETTRLGFALYNYVRPLGRRLIGGHAGARGNGMCFSAEVLQNIPWNAFSQSEDLEYGINLLLQGIPVEFAPEATVLATMPSTPENAESQRSRWEAGRFPIVKRYAWRLLAGAFTRRSFRMFDAFVDLVTPSLVNLLAASISMFAVSLVLWLTDFISLTFAVAWSGLVGAGLLHMLIGIWVVPSEPSLYLTILHIPRYVLWKLILYLRLIGKGHTQEWVRTTRDKK